MRASIFHRFLSSLRKKTEKTRPLVSPEDDVRLVRDLHGRRFPRLRQIAHIGRILSPGERMLFRFSIIVLVVGLVWLGRNLLQVYRVQTPAVGGKYVEAMVGAPKLINPIFAPVNDVDTDISRLVYSGLLRYDADQRLLPDLAVKYDVSGDKKVYTFELKRDVVWHDGEPFTARDVAFTIETIQNTAVGSPLILAFQGVKVNVIDDYKISFTLPEPFTPFLSSLTVGILPEHRWGEIAPESMRLATLNVKPVGTGPYAFSNLVKDESGHISQLQLKRFSRFYRRAAYIEEFTFRFFDQYDGDTGAVKAVRAHDVDGLNFVPFDKHDALDKKSLTLHTVQLPQYSALFFNMSSRSIITEPVARTALAYALDKDRIIRESLRGAGQTIESPLLPGFPGYSADTPKTPYSVEEANAILDKNWSRVPSEEYRTSRRDEMIKEWEKEMDTATTTTSTVAEADREAKLAQIDAELKEELHEAQTFYRKAKDGSIVSVSLVTADTPEYHQAAQLIAGFWQDIGVRTVITFVPVKYFTRDALKTRSYDVLLYSVIIGSDPDQYPFWHSSQIDYPGLNLSRYVNRTVDGILEKIRESSKEDDIAAQSKQFQDQLLKDRPAVFLYSPTYMYATGNEVKGVDITSIFHPADRFANVTDWYIKTKGKWKWGK